MEEFLHHLLPVVSCGLLKPCEKWGDILKYQLVVWDPFHQQYEAEFSLIEICQGS